MHKDWALRNSEHCGTFNEEVNSSLCTKDIYQKPPGEF